MASIAITRAVLVATTYYRNDLTKLGNYNSLVLYKVKEKLNQRCGKSLGGEKIMAR